MPRITVSKDLAIGVAFFADDAGTRAGTAASAFAAVVRSPAAIVARISRMRAAVASHEVLPTRWRIASMRAVRSARDSAWIRQRRVSSC